MEWSDVLADPNFLEQVTALLNWHDPVNLISMGSPVDEYDPERNAIVQRMLGCRSPKALQKILEEEFEYWFGAELLDPQFDISALASDIFNLCIEFLTRTESSQQAKASN